MSKPRGLFIQMSLAALLLGGCATYTLQERADLHILGKPNFAVATHEFQLNVAAPVVAQEAMGIPVRILASEQAFIIVCQYGYERPLYPSLALEGEWATETDRPRQSWELKLPWIMTRSKAVELHIFAMRSFADYDGIHHAMTNGFQGDKDVIPPELACPTFMYDSEAMLPKGMVAHKVITIPIQR